MVFFILGYDEERSNRPALVEAVFRATLNIYLVKSTLLSTPRNASIAFGTVASIQIVAFRNLLELVQVISSSLRCNSICCHNL